MTDLSAWDVMPDFVIGRSEVRDAHDLERIEFMLWLLAQPFGVYECDSSICLQESEASRSRRSA